jgi:hypothetical protein
LAFLLLTSSYVLSASSDEENLLKIPSTYSRLLRPNYGGPAVQVSLSLYITNFELKDRRINVVYYQRAYWNDPRLKQEKEVPTFKADDILPKIWSPDLFLPGALEPPQVINTGFVRILPTGDVIYSRMVKEVIYCAGAKQGHHFLASELTCPIEFESYGYSADDLVVKPKTPFESSVSMDDTLKNQEFYKVVGINATESTITLSSGNNYCRAVFNIELESQLKNLPTSALIAMLQSRGRQ